MKIQKKLLTISMTMLASATLTVFPIQAQSSVHTVQSGEYLSGIAAAYGVSTEELRAWNGLTSDMIYAGDVLVINGSGGAVTTAMATTGGVHTIAAGDTLYTIAQRYGTTIDQLMAWNGLSSDWLTVGSSLVVYGDAVAAPTYTTTANTHGYHTVQPGEYLESIANAYGVTVDDLRAWNGLSSDWLMPGDVLSVYGYATSGVTSTSTHVSSTTNIGNYTVVAGDTLSTIASAYGTTVDHLMAINGLYSTFLQVGDVLYVPGANTATSNVTTSTSETTESTVRDNQVSDDEKPTEAEAQEGIKAKHTVVEGDNLFRIANKYGVTVHNLKVWNQLGEEDTIQVGDVLMIKGATYEPKKHKVTTSDTLESLAQANNTTVERLIEWNELSADETLEVGKELIVSDPKPILHEVKTGETLTQIAEQYSVTTEELREWNELPAATVVVNGTLVVSNPNGDKKEIQSLMPTATQETTQTETTVLEETTTSVE